VQAVRYSDLLTTASGIFSYCCCI